MTLLRKCQTTDGKQVTTPMTPGQSWWFRGSRHVVQRVYVKKVRLDCLDGVLMTVDQSRFVKLAKLMQ